LAKPIVPAGYSGKPLHQKLGFKPGTSVLFVSLPGDLAALAESVEFADVAALDKWSKVSGAARFDAIHAFTASRAEITKNLLRLQKAIKRDGMIWVSWPKKAAKVATDVTEDVVRAEALGLDLVDVKIAAVDAVWSGLKLVIRKGRR
jgi:hypothetical protein